MRFEDLKFKKQTHGGVGATVEFEDVTVSVQAGAFVYSTPREDLLDSTMYSSFEVAVFDKDGRFVTDNFMDNRNKEAVAEILKDFKRTPAGEGDE